VWDEHLVSVRNKQVRKPKKDGWYEHGQNCAEYPDLHFGNEPLKSTQLAYLVLRSAVSADELDGAVVCRVTPDSDIGVS
jgi:hypothetical protein